MLSQFLYNYILKFFFQIKCSLCGVVCVCMFLCIKEHLRVGVCMDVYTNAMWSQGSALDAVYLMFWGLGRSLVWNTPNRLDW